MTYRGRIDDSTLYMGTSLRELVHKFKSKTLVLLKLLLLEKRVSVWLVEKEQDTDTGH